jgi:hypothetical protein
MLKKINWAPDKPCQCLRLTEHWLCSVQSLVWVLLSIGYVQSSHLFAKPDTALSQTGSQADHTCQQFQGVSTINSVVPQLRHTLLPLGKIPSAPVQVGTH